MVHSTQLGPIQHPHPVIITDEQMAQKVLCALQHLKEDPSTEANALVALCSLLTRLPLNSYLSNQDYIDQITSIINDLDDESFANLRDLIRGADIPDSPLEQALLIATRDLQEEEEVDEEDHLDPHLAQQIDEIVAHFNAERVARDQEMTLRLQAEEIENSLPSHPQPNENRQPLIVPPSRQPSTNVHPLDADLAQLRRQRAEEYRQNPRPLNPSSTPQIILSTSTPLSSPSYGERFLKSGSELILKPIVAMDRYNAKIQSGELKWGHKFVFYPTNFLVSLLSAVVLPLWGLVHFVASAIFAILGRNELAKKAALQGIKSVSLLPAKALLHAVAPNYGRSFARQI